MRAYLIMTMNSFNLTENTIYAAKMSDYLAVVF